MKKNISQLIFMLIAAVAFTRINAQQKVSDKPVAVSFSKVEQRKELRKQILKQTQQDAVQTENISKPAEEKTNQPLNKPSLQPMRIPKRKQ